MAIGGADEIRRILFEFVGDSGNLKRESGEAARGLDSANASATRTSKTLMTKLKPAAAAAGVAAAAMAAKWALEGMKMAQSAEVVADSFAETFGPAAAGLNDELEETRVALGQSEAEMQKTLLGIGQLAQGTGMAKDESADFAAELVTMAGDIAAFNGEIENAPEVLNAMQSALKGEFDALEGVNIKINQAMVNERALQDTRKTSADQLTEAEKQYATLALMQEQLADETGALAESSDTAAGKQARFNARMKDAQMEVGKALLPLKELVLDVLLALVPLLEVLNPLLEIITKLIRAFTKALEPLLGYVAKLTRGLADLINKASEAMQKLNPLSGLSLPSFHSGGRVPGPMGANRLAMVQGGETVVPAGSSRARGGGGAGTVVNLTVNAGLSSPDETARRIVDLLENYSAVNGRIDIRTGSRG